MSNTVTNERFFFMKRRDEHKKTLTDSWSSLVCICCISFFSDRWLVTLSRDCCSSSEPSCSCNDCWRAPSRPILCVCMCVCVCVSLPHHTGGCPPTPPPLPHCFCCVLQLEVWIFICSWRRQIAFSSLFCVRITSVSSTCSSRHNCCRNTPRTSLL